MLKEAGCTHRDSNNNFCSQDNYQNHYSILRNVITASDRVCNVISPWKESMMPLHFINWMVIS